MKLFLFLLFLFQNQLIAITFFEVKKDHLFLNNSKLLEYKNKDINNKFEVDSIEVDPSKLISPNDIHIVQNKFAISVQKLSTIRGISLNKEFCSGHCAFDLEIYIEDDLEVDDLLFLYSSKAPQERDTPKLVNLKNIQKGKWVHLEVWVQDYSPMLGKSFDFQVTNPTLLKKVDKSSLLRPVYRLELLKLQSLSSQKNIFIHSISIKKSDVNVLNFKEKEIIQKAFKLFPSHFENVKSMGFLTLFFLFFLLFVIVRIKKKIGIQILLGFFIPIFFAIIFLSIQGLNGFLFSIETSELYEVQKKMHKEILRVNQLGEMIEIDFTYNIEKKLVPKLKKVIKKFREKKIDLSKNHYVNYRKSKTSYSKSPKTFVRDNTLDLQLSEICKPLDLNIMLANKTTTFYSKNSYSTQSIRHIALIFQNYLQLEMDKESQEITTNNDARETLKMIKNIVSTALNDTKIIEQLMTTPSQLIHFKSKSLSLNEAISKLFWTSFIEKKEEKKIVWFVFGGISRTSLLKNLYRHLDKIFNSKNHFSDDYFFLGDYLLRSFSSLDKIDNQLLEIAALSKKNISTPFFPKIDRGELYFYSYHLYEPFLGYSFVLKKSGKDYLQRVQQSKNNIYYGIYFLFFIIYFCSYLLSYIVTKPLYLLSEGMIKIKDGNLENDLKSIGKDQFNEVTYLLNNVLVSLREKEHLSKFLSNTMLNSLDSRSLESIRKEQYIMFCGIQNLKELEQSIGLEKVVNLIDLFLQQVQKSIIKHEGRIDKFTGKSSLSMFDTDIDKQKIVDLLIELKRKLLNFDLLNKVKFGIGLARGSVILGNVGSKQRKDFTVIGSTVNKAARLEALASKTQDLVNIYFDQECLDSFGKVDNLEYFNCDSVYLKGYEKEQAVYELL
ncbi:MAG: hypothetical protein COB02_14105 [Candidatus Cloacimonadota bacterium]|nr:MAG: hypothetical protein COB02_14105 [Candidatus Cloacimonadota bacterium]